MKHNNISSLAGGSSAFILPGQVTAGMQPQEKGHPKQGNLAGMPKVILESSATGATLNLLRRFINLHFHTGTTSFNSGGLALEQAAHGAGHRFNPARDQEEF